MVNGCEILDPREETKARIAAARAEAERNHPANLARAALEAERIAREEEAARLAEEKRKADEWAAIPDSTKIEMLFGHVGELKEVINAQAEVIAVLMRKTRHLPDPGPNPRATQPYQNMSAFRG